MMMAMAMATMTVTMRMVNADDGDDVVDDHDKWMMMIMNADADDER